MLYNNTNTSSITVDYTIFHAYETLVVTSLTRYHTSTYNDIIAILELLRYDLRDRGHETVVFGLGSSDEMCIDFVGYWSVKKSSLTAA